MYVIHLLLPLNDNNRRRLDAQLFRDVRSELTERFGGVTAFVRSPALGLWQTSSHDVAHDEVVTFEVLAPDLDERWWANYRTKLEGRFRQEELMIWAVNAVKL